MTAALRLQQLIHMLHMSNTTSMFYQIGVVERIRLFYKNKWITRSKMNAFLHLSAEDAMSELDEIEIHLFWEKNDVCNVYMVWLCLTLLWFSILYQMISFLSGTFWDKSYMVAICTTFVAGTLLWNTEPIHSN